jgi:two-component system chemotaxis response regulator CheY
MTKVLIVEDDFMCRQLLVELLKKHFETIHIAVNGREAVDAFVGSIDEQQPYDLICLDIMMPEMDGHAALQKIRSIEQQRGIGGSNLVKVLMTTALDNPKDIMNAFVKGSCEGYLLKPLDPEKLYDYLKNFGFYKN